jgi:hypothetical protein
MMMAEIESISARISDPKMQMKQCSRDYIMKSLFLIHQELEANKILSNTPELSSLLGSKSGRVGKDLDSFGEHSHHYWEINRNK